MRKLKTTDIIEAARIVRDLNLKEEIKAMCKKANSVSDIWDEGFDLVCIVLDKALSEQAEQRIYSFIGRILDKSAKDIAEMDALELLEELTEENTVVEWKNFFTKLARLIQTAR